VAAEIAAVKVMAPFWMDLIFAFFITLTGLLYLGTFVYCLLKGKDDLLRSESYSIQRLAIEKGMIGDSRVGLFSPSALGESVSTDNALPSGDEA